MVFSVGYLLAFLSVMQLHFYDKFSLIMRAE